MSNVDALLAALAFGLFMVEVAIVAKREARRAGVEQLRRITQCNR